MTISFGPSGLGPTEDAIKTLEEFNKLGIKACEIAFTRGIYIKEKQDAIEIGKKAKELGLVDAIGGISEVEQYLEQKTGEKPDICWQ